METKTIPPGLAHERARLTAKIARLPEGPAKETAKVHLASVEAAIAAEA